MVYNCPNVFISERRMLTEWLYVNLIQLLWNLWHLLCLTRLDPHKEKINCRGDWTWARWQYSTGQTDEEGGGDQNIMLITTTVKIMAMMTRTTTIMMMMRRRRREVLRVEVTMMATIMLMASLSTPTSPAAAAQPVKTSPFQPPSLLILCQTKLIYSKKTEKGFAALLMMWPITSNCFSFGPNFFYFCKSIFAENPKMFSSTSASKKARHLLPPSTVCHTNMIFYEKQKKA